LGDPKEILYKGKYNGFSSTSQNGKGIPWEIAQELNPSLSGRKTLFSLQRGSKKRFSHQPVAPLSSKGGFFSQREGDHPLRPRQISSGNP